MREVPPVYLKMVKRLWGAVPHGCGNKGAAGIGGTMWASSPTQGTGVRCEGDYGLPHRRARRFAMTVFWCGTCRAAG